MMKRLFNVLTLITALGVSYYTVVLLYDQNDGSAVVTHPRSQGAGGNDSLLFTWATRQVSGSGGSVRVDEPAQVAPTATGEATEMPPCPEHPPDLVGPLHVDLHQKLSLEEVRRSVGESVREGRHQPPHCVSRHKVAIIIPFRGRHEHLNYWLLYLHPILHRQQLDYGVYVINQYGDGIFNRAKLLNVGYVEALRVYNYSCFVFSDVDLVPMDDRNLYRCFDKPRHLAAAMDKFGFQMPYTTFFGGVCSLSKEQYLKINGFPNSYWGWGGEDDDIYQRALFRNMSISRPDLVTGRYKMIRHNRDRHNEANPKNSNKVGEAHLHIDTDGLNTLDYKVVAIVKDSLFTNITVDIEAPPAE